MISMNAAVRRSKKCKEPDLYIRDEITMSARGILGSKETHFGVNGKANFIRLAVYKLQVKDLRHAIGKKALRCPL